MAAIHVRNGGQCWIANGIDDDGEKMRIQFLVPLEPENLSDLCHVDERAIIKLMVSQESLDGINKDNR